MTKHPRLILTRDGERAFGRLADGIARALDRVLRTEQVKKKELAERAGVDQAVVSRVLDGSRNVEIRTVAVLFGAVGYVLDVEPKRIHGEQGPTNRRRPIFTPVKVSGDGNASSGTAVAKAEFQFPTMRMDWVNVSN